VEHLFTVESLIAFLVLCLLELVLGIDNIIFISIISDKLPKHQQQKARSLGLTLAVVTRLGLLLSLSWVISLTNPLFWVFNYGISGRDLLLLAGGLFLIAKSTHEIHQKLESPEEQHVIKVKPTFAATLVQILLLDIVFSLDSVITAVGMVNDIPIMAAAIIISTGIMILSSRAISEFIDRYPTLKMLALSFLVLIGFTLIAEGLGQHISKSYIYFAIAYSLGVEALNIRLQKKKKSPS
jgi:predicted tellurium resistance membrane protein TerC